MFNGALLSVVYCSDVLSCVNAMSVVCTAMNPQQAMSYDSVSVGSLLNC